MGCSCPLLYFFILNINCYLLEINGLEIAHNLNHKPLFIEPMALPTVLTTYVFVSHSVTLRVCRQI